MTSVRWPNDAGDAYAISGSHDGKAWQGTVIKLHHPIPDDSPIRDFRCKSGVNNEMANMLFTDASHTVLVMNLNGRFTSAVACAKSGKSAVDKTTGKKVTVETWLRIEVMCSWYGGSNLLRFLQDLPSEQQLAIFGYVYSAIKLSSSTQGVRFYTRNGFVRDPKKLKGGGGNLGYNMMWIRPAADDPRRPTNAAQSRPTNAAQSRPTNAAQSRPTNAAQSRPTNAAQSRPTTHASVRNSTSRHGL
jgi:hypothetical protein